MENRLPTVPAHLVSLSGERVLRMRVDPLMEEPLARPAPTQEEAKPLVTFDLSPPVARLRVRFGVAPDEASESA